MCTEASILSATQAFSKSVVWHGVMCIADEVYPENAISPVVIVERTATSDTVGKIRIAPC